MRRNQPTRRRWPALILLSAVALLGSPPKALAQDQAKLHVTVARLKNNQPLPDRYAFCVPARTGHVKPGPDLSPAIRWSKGPSATRSYAIIMYDPDAPADRRNMNQEGKTVFFGTPRRTFYHWVLVDLPATTTALPQGADSRAFTRHGKPPGPTPHGLRGVNSYTQVFAMTHNTKMMGTYGGYDGPCPPWNDERPHHYHFTVYALDIPKLQLAAGFDAAQALQAMKGHVLARGEAVGVYSLSPAVRGKLHMD